MHLQFALFFPVNFDCHFGFGSVQLSIRKVCFGRYIVAFVDMLLIGVDQFGVLCFVGCVWGVWECQLFPNASDSYAWHWPQVLQYGHIYISPPIGHWHLDDECRLDDTRTTTEGVRRAIYNEISKVYHSDTTHTHSEYTCRNARMLLNIFTKVYTHTEARTYIHRTPTKSN